MGADKTLKLSGKAVCRANGNKLEIEGLDGLITAVVGDANGNVLLMYHPLSGWYVEMDMRKEGNDGQPK